MRHPRLRRVGEFSPTTLFAIPVNGFLETLFETGLRLEAKLSLRTAGVKTTSRLTVRLTGIEPNLDRETRSGPQSSEPDP